MIIQTISTETLTRFHLVDFGFRATAKGTKSPQNISVCSNQSLKVGAAVKKKIQGTIVAR